MPAVRILIFTAFATFLAALLFYLFTANAKHELPTLEHPIQWYFTELHAPLRSVIVDGIKEAQSSLLVVIYQLRDEKIIEAIREKSDRGIPVYVVVDESGFEGGRKKLGKNTTLIKRNPPGGIMHEKLLIVDKSKVYLGSTNFTFESVNLHANDWVGIFSPTLAEKVWQRVKKMNDTGKIEPGFAIHAKVENRTLEMWFTPNPDALKKIEQLIDGAKTSIHVAMYTFTNQKLTQKLIEAKQRGVKVTIATDAQQSKNVNKLALQQMKQAREYLGVGLFHHKFMVIDGHTMVIGSLNWTKQAFKENDDCFIIIPLTESDQTLINRVWEAILSKTKENSYASRTVGVWEDGKSYCTPRPLLWPHDHCHHKPLIAQRPATRERHPKRRSVS